MSRIHLQNQKQKTTKIMIAAASILVATLVLSVLPAASLGNAYATASSTTTTTKIPIHRTFTPIGPGCEDAERIALSGTINFVDEMTTNSNGETTHTIHFNPQGVTGVGEETGTTYRGTGSTTTTVTFDENHEIRTRTFVNNFNIIATEPSGISSIEHNVVHVTVNAQGEITAKFDFETSTCR
jgi:hypothetical protein